MSIKQSSLTVVLWVILSVLGIKTPVMALTPPQKTLVPFPQSLGQWFDPHNQSVAQTAIGYCEVADPTGTPLNVRDRPNGRVVGTLENGTKVALGVTDGSEGADWAKVIQPLEGYVWRAYLINCQDK